MERAFAGILRFEPGRERTRDRVDLREGLREEPSVDDIALGPLALAFSGPRPRPAEGGMICLLGGHVHELDALRQELELGESDPESILATGYGRWGEGLLARLRGSFVVVLWDPAAKRGIVACDQLGARSLFLHGTGRGLLLASELKGLLRLIPSRPEPDRLAVLDWLARSRLPAGRTLYEAVHPLRPAHFLRLEEGGRKAHRYWRPRYLPRNELSRSEAVEGLRSEIEGATARHFASTGRTGLLLSGGIDSSTIAAASLPLCRSNGRSLRTYSAVFPGFDSADESSLIDALTGELSLDGVRMAPHGGSALSAALDFLERWETPLVAPNHFFMRRLLRRASDEGVSVILRGEGGDELFGAPRFLLADRLGHGRVISAWRLANRYPGARDRDLRSVLSLLRRYGLRGAIPGPIHRAGRRLRGPARYVPDWFTGASARLYLEHDREWQWKSNGGPRWWSQLAYMVTRNPEEAGALEFLRRQDVEAGLRGGHPFMDVNLIEFVLGLPPEYAFDHYSRPLLRESVDGLMPDRIRLRNEKSFFNAVVDQAVSAPGLGPARELLESPGAEIHAFVRPDRVRSLLEDGPDRHAGGGVDWSGQLWRLMTAEIWLRFQADRGITERLSSCWNLPEPQCEFETVESA